MGPLSEAGSCALGANMQTSAKKVAFLHVWDCWTHHAEAAFAVFEHFS